MRWHTFSSEPMQTYRSPSCAASCRKATWPLCSRWSNHHHDFWAVFRFLGKVPCPAFSFLRYFSATKSATKFFILNLSVLKNLSPAFYLSLLTLSGLYLASFIAAFQRTVRAGRTRVLPASRGIAQPDAGIPGAAPGLKRNFRAGIPSRRPCSCG